jgi:hypothetical protein
LPDDTNPGAADPDEVLFEQIKAGGYDTTKEYQIGFRIDFDPAVARQAAGDLILAGYPSVRLELEATPAVIVTVHLVPSLDSLRSARANLDTFANARDAEVTGVLVGGGIDPQKDTWKKDESGLAGTDQADQRLLDVLFAWDVDVKEEMTFSGGLLFHAEAEARAAAAALMIEGFPEVRVTATDFGQVAEAVMYMRPELKAIRKLRLHLTTFVTSRGATWLGFHVAAKAPTN